MKKQIVAFEISLGVLILAVTAFVVWRNWPLFPESPANEETVATEPVDLLAEEKEFEDNHNRPVGMDAYLRRGRGFLQAGDFVAAESEFAKAAQLAPEVSEPLLLLAESQIRQREIEKARANIAAAREIDSENPRVKLLDAVADIREEKFPAADEKLKMLDTAEARFWRGLLASFYDRRDEAEELLLPLSDSASHKIMLAYEEFDGFPDSTKAHLDTLLARSYNELGEYELAIAKIKPALAEDPDYRDAWILFGYAEFARGNADIAKQAWSTAYALDSSKPETQYFLGLANFELEDFENAARYLLLARQNGFAAPDLDEKLADSFYETEKFREAAELYSALAEANPHATASDYIRPVFLFLEKADDGRTAWTVAAKSLKRFPNDPASHNLAGWISLKNGYLEEAEQHLSSALRLDPGYSWAYLNLGKVALANGDEEIAREKFKTAYETDKTGDVAPLAAEEYNKLIEN